METLYTHNTIRTFTGKYINVFEPTIDMICIEDIAHALSNQCRFGGHLPEFYSVADHCLYCTQLVESQHQMAALLHDASEAYLLDVPRPIKNHLTNYKEIEHNLMLLISEKFKFQYPLHDDVKNADEIALVTEWDELMIQQRGPKTLVTSHPLVTKSKFLATFAIYNAFNTNK